MKLLEKWACTKRIKYDLQYNISRNLKIELKDEIFLKINYGDVFRMIDKDELIDMIETTPIEKIEGPEDIWDLIHENHDTDLTFCSPSQKEPWSDESSFEEIGDISHTKICTWSDQNHIEDIAEDITNEVTDWLEKD
jgi:hypothetical protein